MNTTPWFFKITKPLADAEIGIMQDQLSSLFIRETGYRLGPIRTEGDGTVLVIENIPTDSVSQVRCLFLAYLTRGHNYPARFGPSREDLRGLVCRPTQCSVSVSAALK